MKKYIKVITAGLILSITLLSATSAHAILWGPVDTRSDPPEYTYEPIYIQLHPELPESREARELIRDILRERIYMQCYSQLIDDQMNCDFVESEFISACYVSADLEYKSCIGF